MRKLLSRSHMKVRNILAKKESLSQPLLEMECNLYRNGNADCISLAPEKGLSQSSTSFNMTRIESTQEHKAVKYCVCNLEVNIFDLSARLGFDIATP